MGVSDSRPCTRFALFAFLSLLTLFTWSLVVSDGQRAWAQAGDGEAEAPAGEVKEAPADNFLVHMAKSTGPFFGVIIGSISLTLVALIVLLFMDLRMNVAIPPDFVEEFTDTVNKRRFKEAFELARNDNSFLGRVLTAGMGRLQYGIDDAREVILNTVESIKAGKEQLISYLATIGTLGPLIGLVGTVYGMILSFMELGRGGTPNAAKLSAGISHALVLTLLGVGLSLPAIGFHAFFRSRLIRISMDTSNIADDLLTQMYHNSRKPVAPSTNAAAAAPAGKPVQG
jgi:biopolymer transport protein ExbB